MKATYWNDFSEMGGEPAANVVYLDYFEMPMQPTENIT